MLNPNFYLALQINLPLKTAAILNNQNDAVLRQFDQCILTESKKDRISRIFQIAEVMLKEPGLLLNLEVEDKQRKGGKASPGSASSEQRTVR